ncbi:MAG: sulfatase-like hydrolase/transferase [Bacteroidales bacterium]|nr:sulfatase-like hydrolase/transferase [Bacteroidales bacterium]
MKKLLSIISEFTLPLYRYILLLLIYAILRISFYLFNYTLFPNVDFGGFCNIMYGGLRFDISALTYLNLIYFLLYYLSFRLKYRPKVRKTIDGIFFTVNGLGIMMNCIDFIYYRFILHRTTFNTLDSLKNEDNMVSLCFQFLIDYWYVVVFYVAVMYFFVRLTLCVRPRPSAIRSKLAYALTSVVVFAIIGGLSVAAIRGGFRHSTRPIAMSNAAAYTNSPEESAIVLNTPFAFIRTIGKKSFPHVEYFAENEIDSIFTPIHEPIAADSAAMTRRNVVIFILESFSREFLGSFNPTLENGDYKGYTPFLDSLSQHSLVFTNAYANGRKSIDAMPSVLASIPALIMPYVISEYSSNKINSIASLLGSEGYQTAFFHGAPNGSMGFDGFAKIARFDSYFGKNEYNNDDDFDGIWGIWDHAFFKYYAQTLNTFHEPFCTALFSLSSHHPFNVPEQFEGRFPEGPLPVEKCIGYSDNALRLFFAEAKKMPWYQNTLFVITADHSSIPDHDEYKNNAQAFAVPIIFFSPSDTALVGRDDRLAQQIDIMPTILSYLGYDKPYVSFGHDLRNADNQRFAINYNNDTYQIYLNDTIAYFDGKKTIGAYDMKNDPNLTTNVYEEGRAVEHETLVKAFIQQFNNRMRTDNLTINQ